MNDPCRLELRGLSGSEPCGACNHPAREHRGHREYVEPEYWTVEYMIGNSDWISHGLGVYTTRAGAEEALKLCSIHVDSKRVARCDASSRIVSSSVAAVETFEPAKHSEPDSTTVTMSQDAYDAAIAGAKREGWSRAVLKLRDGHRFVQASDCLARTIPDAWPAPPNPLTAIASAMGCDENEAACLDAIDSLRRELSAAEDASSMERQRRKDAEQERDARPAITRKQARAWLDLAIEHGSNAVPSTGSVEYVAALALAKFAAGLVPLRTHDAESIRDAAVDLASHHGEQVSRLTAELAKALEAARSRGFPEALREQIAAWDQLRSGCRSAHDLIRDVHAWLASQPADETEALRARVRALEEERAARTRATNRSLDRYREESDALRTIDSKTRAKIEESGYQRGVEEAATAALTTARHCQISSFVDGRTYELLDRDEVVRAIRALATRGAT